MIRVLLFASLLVLTLLTADAQEPTKFVGTWQATTKAVGFDHSLTLTFDNGKWSVLSTYAKEGGPSGTAQGNDIKFETGKLLYVQKHIKKPVASWKDSDDVVSLSFKGDQLELFNVTTNKSIRLYDRVEKKDASKVAAKDPPKKEMPKTEVPKTETVKIDPPKTTPPTVAAKSDKVAVKPPATPNPVTPTTTSPAFRTTPPSTPTPRSASAAATWPRSFPAAGSPSSAHPEFNS